MQPLDPTVHHLQSAGGDTSTTVLRLLLGLPQPVPVANVSAMLTGIVKRVYEVISVQVQGGALPWSSPWGGGIVEAESPAGEGWSSHV